MFFNSEDELKTYLAQQAAWQNQLTNGANIANSGWQTALGLALGTGLGSWLGNKYWNMQQKRDENFINDAAPKQLTQQASRNLLGNLDWRLPQTPQTQWQWPTAQGTFADATTRFNPNQPRFF